MSTTHDDQTQVLTPPGKPRKKWHQRWAVRIPAGPAALAIGAGALGAAVGHHPARTTAAAPSYQDAGTCQGLATATAAVESGGYGIGGGHQYTPIAQIQQLIWSAPTSVFSPGFRQDLLAVVGDPAKPGYGLYTPSAQQIAVLQADCAAHGVTGPVWPGSLTAAGN
jgi:hypothetical protein